MSRVEPDDSLPERLRRMVVTETISLVERLELTTATQQQIDTVMGQLRNRASSAIARATDKGRKYHRSSVVNLDEQHNPMVSVMITRTT